MYNRLIIFVIHTLAVFGCITSACASDESHFIPDGSVKYRVIEGIEYCRRNIDICIHDFAALDIDRDLEHARSRGIRAHVVILEYDKSTSRGKLTEALIQKGFDVRILKLSPGVEREEDFIILDERVVITGVYNWLAYRDRNTDNTILFSYDNDKIRAYKDTFCKLFSEGEPSSFLVSQKDLVVQGSLPVSDAGSDKTSAGQVSQGIPLSKELPENESSKPAQESKARDFIDLSLEDMWKQLGKGSALSRSEKNELWKKYKDKYVRWHGVIVYKGMGRVDWNRVGVGHQGGKDAEVEIIFDWQMFEKVMELRIGNTITFTGKLVSRPGFNAPCRLDDGDIE